MQYRRLGTTNLDLSVIGLGTMTFGEQTSESEAIKQMDHAVEKGVMVTESDPNCTSVGYGGMPDREGNVTLDACIMDETGNCGSVSFLQNIMHPISVARKVMEDTPHVMLSGKGALQFAIEKGFKEEDLLTEKAKKRWKKWLQTSEYKPNINIENHDQKELMKEMVSYFESKESGIIGLTQVT